MIGWARPAAAAAILFAGNAGAQALILRGLDGKAHAVTPAEMAGLPRRTAALPREGGGLPPASCEGVALADLLGLVGAPASPLRGAGLGQAIVARGADGYRAVLASAEADPSMRATPVIVADRCESQALDARQGPLRLVVEGDRRPARSVRQLTEIDLVSVP